MAPSQADAVETANKIVYDCWSHEQFGTQRRHESAHVAARASPRTPFSPRNIAVVLLAGIALTTTVLWLGNWWLTLQ